MKKILKFLLYSIFGLVVLSTIAVGLVLMLVDPNDHKAEIAEFIESQTGRRLEIKQDLSLSFFPWLGVKLTDLTLGNAAGFDSEPFARAASIHVRVKLLPLIQQKVEVDTVSIQTLHLNLATDAAGKNNWDDLIADPVETTTEQPTTGSSSPAETTLPLAALTFHGLEMSDASISYKDASKGSNHQVKALQLNVGRFAERETIPVQMAFHWQTGAELKGSAHLNSSVTIDLTKQQFFIVAKEIKLNAADGTATAKSHKLEGAFTLDADLGKNSIQLSKVNMDAETTGHKINVSLNNPLSFDLNQQRLHLSDPDLSIKAEGASIPGGHTQLNANIILTADLKAKRITLKKLHLKETAPDLTSQLFLDDPLTYDMTNKIIHLVGKRIKLSMAGKPIPGGKAEVTTALDVRIDLNMQKLLVKKLNLDGTLSKNKAHIRLNDPIRFDMAEQFLRLAEKQMQIHL